MSDSQSKTLVLDSQEQEAVVASGQEEIKRSDLLSINQAILQGSYLRGNSFVKDCEAQGFYFLSMTLALVHSKSSEMIQVRIRFKLSPKMFPK